MKIFEEIMAKRGQISHEKISPADLTLRLILIFMRAKFLLDFNRYFFIFENLDKVLRLLCQNYHFFARKTGHLIFLAKLVDLDLR